MRMPGCDPFSGRLLSGVEREFKIWRPVRLLLLRVAIARSVHLSVKIFYVNVHFKEL